METRWTSLPLILGTVLAAQAPQRLDFLTFTLPAGEWRTETKAGALQFFQELPGKGYCRLTLYRAVPTMGSHERDAAADWERLILDRHPGFPKGKSRTQPLAGNAWTFTQQIGMGPLGGTEAVLSVHTFTGQGQHMSVVFESTHPSFDALLNPFINGIQIQGPAQAVMRPVAQSSVGGQPTSLVGKWRRANASYSHWGTHFTGTEIAKAGSQGSVKWLYEFTPGGTYTFVCKFWPLAGSDITYTRESGSYGQEPGALTLTPTRSVMEVWTRRRDKPTLPDRLKASQSNPLTATRYRTAWHYWTGQREWNLVLMADQETLRDGRFSTMAAFPNAWYYAPVGPDATVD